MDRLRAAGYAGQFTPLEDGIRRYVQDFLAHRTHIYDPLCDWHRLGMIPVLLFPQFDPVLVQVGPLGIRWYALAYIVGLVLGWRLLRRLVLAPPARRHAGAGGRLPDLGDAGRRAGRAARLRAVLPAEHLSQPSAADLRRLAGRHELPRRAAGRRGRDRLVLPPQRHPDARLRRPGGRVRAARACARPGRQLHQRRAVGPAGAGLAALGHGVSLRRAGARGIPASFIRRCWRACCCSW